MSLFRCLVGLLAHSEASIIGSFQGYELIVITTIQVGIISCFKEFWAWREKTYFSDPHNGCVALASHLNCLGLILISEK